MPKVNVYLPDDLAAAVREAGIPVSTVCQRALEDALRRATALREGNRRTAPILPAGLDGLDCATPRLARALELAFAQARRRHQSFVGTEHLLLGVLDEGENLAVRVIAAMDVMPVDLRAELEATMGAPADSAGLRGPNALAGLRGPNAVAGDPDPAEPVPTRVARRALELMVKETKQLGHNYAGCEHLLLGLIREGEGVAGRVLRTMGLDVSVTRRAIITALTGFVHARANVPMAKGAAPVGSAVEARLSEISARLARLEDRLGEE